MARQARERSKTGIYHVMLKGIDGRNIFLEDEDKAVFIEKMFKAKEKAEFKIMAYCLMSNHVHLLIEESEEIGISIKRMTVAYVQWHNNKYGRTGHLFQNRYNSEVVENDHYLVTVTRYIHRNPLKAKMVKQLVDYQWSSYRSYLSSYKGVSSDIDTQRIRSYFNQVEDFEKFSKEENDDDCLDENVVMKITDSKIHEIIGLDHDSLKFSEMTANQRDSQIRKLHQETGASIRQLARVLGLGKGIIEKAIK